MKTILQAAAAIVPLLALPASAASSSLVCNTRMGTKSVAVVPSSTTTVTASLQPTLTVAVQSTVTRWSGAVYTFTEFSTETSTTTDSTITDVYTTTTTEMPTSTHIDTSMITSWSTSTATVTSTSTTTIATTQGFRNIRDTLNDDNGLYRRALANPLAGRAAAKPAVKQGVLAMAYPSRIDCTLTKPNTRTVTVTSRKAATTKTVPYWAYRTTSVSTISSTLTLVPDDVTSTETDTVTSTVTVSSTTFVTDFESTSTTATALMHGPTVWNACNDQNYLGPNFNHNANGDSYPYYITNVDNNGAYVGSNFKITANGAGSMLECCNLCMKFGTCETFMYRAHSRNCFLMYHDGETCPSQGNHPNFFLSTSGSDTGAGWQVGNGLCGYTYSGNTDSTGWRVDP